MVFVWFLLGKFYSTTFEQFSDIVRIRWKINVNHLLLFGMFELFFFFFSSTFSVFSIFFFSDNFILSILAARLESSNSWCSEVLPFAWGLSGRKSGLRSEGFLGPGVFSAEKTKKRKIASGSGLF